MSRRVLEILETLAVLIGVAIGLGAVIYAYEVAPLIVLVLLALISVFLCVAYWFLGAG